ncbi:MAG: ComF family protein [Bacteroidota bacterium]
MVPTLHPLIRAARSVTDLFLPLCCPGCRSTPLNPNEFLCMDCRTTLPFTRFEVLRSNSVEKLFWGRLPFSFASTTMYFIDHSPFQHIVHAIKYQHHTSLARCMGNLMGHRLCDPRMQHPIDLLIPMPLHRSKEKKRGYNQAELLCTGLSEATGIPIGNTCIQRNLKTATQTKKSRTERWDNVRTAFPVDVPERFSNKHLLLVDDVITTGASLEACGQTALLHGAASVSFAGLAFTP